MLLASGGSSGEVILFDVFAKKSKRKVEAHDLGVNWVEFYPEKSSWPATIHIEVEKLHTKAGLIAHE